MLGLRINNNNSSSSSSSRKSIVYYLCAAITAARPITERAYENKKNTQIQATDENT